MKHLKHTIEVQVYMQGMQYSQTLEGQCITGKRNKPLSHAYAVRNSVDSSACNCYQTLVFQRLIYMRTPSPKGLLRRYHGYATTSYPYSQQFKQNFAPNPSTLRTHVEQAVFELKIGSI